MRTRRTTRSGVFGAAGGAGPALACAVVLASCPARADHIADPENGLPLIESIEPAMFDSPGTPVGSQAFDIERLPDGTVLVANNEGLLRLEGTGWRTWNPLRGAVLSLAVRGDGRVFVGGVGDFGYFDRFGGEFVSLKSWSEHVRRRFGEVWAIVAAPAATHFIDRERVYRWRDEGLEVVYEGRGELRQGALLGESALVLDPAAGLVLLGDGEARVLEGSAALAASDSCAFAATGAQAATVCSDGTLRLWSAGGQERNVELDAVLAGQLVGARISAMTAIAPDAYAIGTRRGGRGRFVGRARPWSLSRGVAGSGQPLRLGHRLAGRATGSGARGRRHARRDDGRHPSARVHR